MGCDGGSIPRRDELVKTKKAAERPDAAIQLSSQWNLCSLSKLPLKEPLVSCYLGRLYNKDAILNHLLKKVEYGDADVICPHIKSTKDIKNLTVTPNPLANTVQKSNILSHYADSLDIPAFICPITQKEMNGHSRFIFPMTCGCVFSELALKTVQSSTCLVCNNPFEEDDIILINPASEEDVKKAKDRLEFQVKLQETKKAERKADKKRKKADNPDLLVGSDEEKKKKKKSPPKTKAVAAESLVSNINMRMPDLSSLSDPRKGKSSAISSLYLKKEKDGSVPERGNFLTKGTHNRYSAC